MYSGDYRTSFEIDDAHIRGSRVRDIRVLAVAGDVDEIRSSLYTDGRGDRVGLGVDHRDVVRSAIDHVNLILCAVSSDTGRIASNMKSLRQSEITKVDHADSVALAVGDIGEFTKGRSVIGQLLLAEIPPSDSAKDGHEHSDDEEFAQGSISSREEKSSRGWLRSLMHRNGFRGKETGIDFRKADETAIALPTPALRSEWSIVVRPTSRHLRR